MLKVLADILMAMDSDDLTVLAYALRPLCDLRQRRSRRFPSMQMSCKVDEIAMNFFCILQMHVAPACPRFKVQFVIVGDSARCTARIDFLTDHFSSLHRHFAIGDQTTSTPFARLH